MIYSFKSVTMCCNTNIALYFGHNELHPYDLKCFFVFFLWELERKDWDICQNLSKCANPSFQVPIEKYFKSYGCSS